MGDAPTLSRPDVDVRSARLDVRAASFDDESLTMRATISTETPCRAIDWDRWEEVDEILCASGFEAPASVRMLDSHKRNSVDDILGSVRDFNVGGDDIDALFEFDHEDPRARRAYGKAKRGHLTDVSVGYRVTAHTTIEPGETATVDGRAYTAQARPLRVATKWTLREVSPCPIGADPNAKFREQIRAARERAAAGGGATMDPDQTTGTAERETPEPIDLEAARAAAATKAVAAERERVRKIRDLAGSDVPADVLKRAVDEGWDEARASREFLTAIRAKAVDGPPVETGAGSEQSGERGAPYGFTRGSYERSPSQRLRELGFGLRHQVGAPVMPIADLVRDYANEHRRASDNAVREGRGPLPPRVFGISDAARGIPGADRLSKPDYERAAEEGYAYRNLSAMDYLREMYEIATGGKRAPRGQAIFDHIGWTRRGIEIDGMRAAGVSTADLANVFTDSVTAQLIAMYELAGDTTIFVREADVADFRSQERPRGTAINPMQKLPTSGAKPVGFNSMGDTVETYKAARYADQFAFDERAFIDDRLDLFASIPGAMGRNAAQVRPDLVYYILLNGATAGLAAGAIFSSGNGNYVASSGALANTTLQTAISAMRTQTETSPDGSSRNLNIEPVYLVTAQANRWTALELMNSTLIVVSGGTTQGVRGNVNTLSGALQVVSDARFDNGVTDPDSGSAASADADGWALVAGQQHPTIEVGYVRATGRAPVIRPYMLDKGQWGMGWDIKLDIGAKALDYRGLYYSKGA